MMNKQPLSVAAHARLLQCQKDEHLGHSVYAYMAKREKNAENQRLLTQMAADEQEHERIWRGYTGKKVAVGRLAILWFKLLTVLFGFTFVIKTLQRTERLSAAEYAGLAEEIPEAAAIERDERRHEAELTAMLDEERLQYVGAMVLGLNDALVELTGAIAGTTFALANTRLVALTGIITGVSATLSMTASYYLAESADGNPKALRSSLYTGMAYLITVALLVLPYLLFPAQMYAAAFVTMIVTVILIILLFNYYISVAREQPFLRRFVQMAVISLSVAVIAFMIGLLAKNLLGLDTI